MTHCDFSARLTRDEMRHIIGDSEVRHHQMGATKIITEDARVRTKITWNSYVDCTKRKRTCGRYFEH